MHASKTSVGTKMKGVAHRISIASPCKNCTWFQTAAVAPAGGIVNRDSMRPYSERYSFQKPLDLRKVLLSVDPTYFYIFYFYIFYIFFYFYLKVAIFAMHFRVQSNRTELFFLFTCSSQDIFFSSPPMSDPAAPAEGRKNWVLCLRYPTKTSIV